MNTHLGSIERRLDTIEALLRQLLNPAQSLSAEAKAEAVRKALATGDKKILRETMKQINGE
ncbi:hypothetical protein [Desulfogranum marinum]|uniref:hypothetical protein n=1 Tax=Desulfogranum marinum TaxID=453220 RepID=UPI0029C95F4B|nr:hypothetical protein [Desulfogranum marinum]